MPSVFENGWRPEAVAGCFTVPPAENEPMKDYAPGTVQVVEQHDGSTLVLRKLDDEYDVSDRVVAMNFLARHAAQGQIVTGLLYVDSEPEDLHQHLATAAAPLNSLGDDDLCPGAATLDAINASLR